ncbi:MAG: division/cell wall cluster transcriptional repressor MraZ [Deltaproteobacteria bacterium]|nr:division/cell wall cluster transcriptional repressor MraZ [Deltaproteobacteria bacterium]
MSRFRGIFVHTIDSKGRLSVPNRFRDALKAKQDERLVITWGPRKSCLWVYSMDGWLGVEEDVDRLPAGPEKDAFMHHFLSPALDLAMDKMGRILVPSDMREGVGLNHEVSVVGASNKFEIWDRGRFEAHLAATQDSAFDLLKSNPVRL